VYVELHASFKKCKAIKINKYIYIYRYLRLLENNFIWEKELVIKSWKLHKIDLWKRIEILIFKSFDIVCEYVKFMVRIIVII
jgi:hypothetical protein